MGASASSPFAPLSGRLVTEWLINVLVLLIEMNFLLKKKVLHFDYGLKRSVQIFIWLGLILLAWALLFDGHGVKRSRKTSRILGLINVVRSSGLFTISNTLESIDVEKGEQTNKEITSAWEAKAVAYDIFLNIAKRGSKHIEEDDLLRFMKKEEVDLVLLLFEGAAESGKIKRKALKTWLVNVYLERKSLAHSLNDTKTAIEELNRLASGLLLLVILIVWLLLMGLLTTNILAFISSQLLLVVFVYGALRALETFSQLCTLYYGSKSVQVYRAPWYIRDSPRFAYRGLLLDTSRHYLPVDVIKQVIESMSYAKLNVLHWHIIDRESFPLKVPSYPKLWKGSYTKWERYTVEDEIEIVSFAKTRGINVMAEIDVPGHAESWGAGYPNLWPSTSCKEPLDVSKSSTFDVVSGIQSDMRKIFPFELFHLGVQPKWVPILFSSLSLESHDHDKDSHCGRHHHDLAHVQHHGYGADLCINSEFRHVGAR
ncbi:hypothetical protein L3X38_024191 [Prunus dulcis]|uniref:beta-N-acetylhexosaminidase n=1 Tax=Prunus dulcis TaxID=3755 RepID=A0AAD4Z6S5_PRUDU|nr:hypothetical protein L3X38_024191 [Prunus dulcis]